MVQKEQVGRTPAVIETIPKASTKRPRSIPWLIGALVAMTLAFLALAAFTGYQRYHRTSAANLAQHAAAAWDTARPSALTDVYARNAVVVHADGTKIAGIKAIVADARARGPAFTMTQVGDISTSPNGALAAFTYRYSDHGRGSGIAVLKIARGKIVRQWNFETIAVRAPAPK
jgi:hypothetical protein